MNIKTHSVWESYGADEDGNIYSLRFGKTKKLKLSLHSEGYQHFTPCVKTKKVNAFVHRFVMECFHGLSELVVNHKDGNKQNNALSNLEFCTYAENTKHALEIGLFGDRSTLTDSDRDFIRCSHGELSIDYVARKLGVHRRTVMKIRSAS